MYFKIFFIMLNPVFFYAKHQLDFKDINNSLFRNNDVKDNILKIYLGDKKYEDMNLDVLMQNMQNVFYYLESVDSDLLKDQTIELLFSIYMFFLTFNGEFDKISNNSDYNVNLQKFIQKTLLKNVKKTFYNEYLFLILIINDKTLSDSDKYFQIERLFLLYEFKDDENYAIIEKIIKDDSINNVKKYKKIEFFVRNTLTNEKFYKTVCVNDDYKYLISILNEVKNNKLDKIKLNDILLDKLITKIISILICDYLYKPRNIERLTLQRSFDNYEIICTLLYALEDELGLPGHNEKLKNKLSNWFID